MLYYVLNIVYIIVCFLLMLVILLQQGKGGDIAAAFGGGGSQAAFGARSGASVLSRATATGAVLFIFGALVLGILGQDGPGSVIGGRAPLASMATVIREHSYLSWEPWFPIGFPTIPEDILAGDPVSGSEREAAVALIEFAVKLEFMCPQWF